jgi:hypothetical protein
MDLCDPIYQARYDYQQGCSLDNNPYNYGGRRYQLWEEELQKLLDLEEQKDQSELCSSVFPIQ